VVRVFWQTPGTRAGRKLQGNGVTKIMEGGRVFERAGCGFSHVRGPQLPPSATQHRPELAGAPFEAMGVSLVFHPRNPLVPTVHMNVRMISAGHEGQPKTCWFGGGMDLTPVYGFEEDAVHFHQACHDALAPFGEQLYPRFKQWCDEYFFLKHRNEQRGIGGIFFDDFSELGQQQSFAMLRSVGDAFLKAYLPIVERRKNLPYTQQQVDFPAIRRALCGVQSGLGPRHAFRPAVRRPYRIHFAVHAAPCGLELSARGCTGTPERDLLDKFLIRRDWL
jgi:coproporphyrinogen III oxidase